MTVFRLRISWTDDYFRSIAILIFGLFRAIFTEGQKKNNNNLMLATHSSSPSPFAITHPW